MAGRVQPDVGSGSYHWRSLPHGKFQLSGAEMIPVNQTRFKGSEAPQEEQGNCFQACVASIFELPLEEAFDCLQYSEERWFDAFNSWLKPRGLACVFIHGVPVASEFWGYHLAGVKSTTLRNPDDGHVVVMKDGSVVHDPNPNSQGLGENTSVFLFLPPNAGESRYNI